MVLRLLASGDDGRIEEEIDVRVVIILDLDWEGMACADVVIVFEYGRLEVLLVLLY